MNSFRAERQTLKSVYVLPWAILALALAQQLAHGTNVIRVGAGRAYASPSSAAKLAQDGDIIEIDPGIYSKDVAVWTQNDLTIRGVGSRPHLRADGANAEGKGIWVIKGNNTTVENIEFSNATVPDGNGAGIRLEGTNLTLRRTYFHDNENGVLTGKNTKSEILIEYSEFARNGAGDGQTHNIYVGEVKSFTIQYSYLHHAKVGHNVKTRAAVNRVLYNRIVDEWTGTSSYSVDLPNGGQSFLIGNLLQQGPATENWTIVSFGAEGFKHSVNELYVINSTMVNDRPSGGIFIQSKPGSGTIKVINNLFVGPGTILEGSGEMTNNLSLKPSDFKDPGNFDYRLKPGSIAINAGINPGRIDGVDLMANSEYEHEMKRRPRKIKQVIDVGAFEYREESVNKRR